MKTPLSPKKSAKSRSTLRLTLAVHAVPLAAVAHFRRTARRALQAARQQGRCAISLVFVDQRTMRRLNRQFAGNDYVTDVLSFPAHESPRVNRAQTSDEFLGEIIICLPQAAQQARDARHTLTHEVDVLLTHGVLHLLGYDHYTEAETQAMRALEEKALRGKV